MLEVITRFAEAQDAPAPMSRARGRTWFEVALDELELGAKVSHWIWWTFPQFLPNRPVEEMSANSRKYAINDTDEAIAYINTPLLCNRYHDLTRVVLDHLSRRTVVPVVLMGGATDCKKLVSSLTLFAAVAFRSARLELARDAISVLVFMEAAGFGICQHTLQKIDFSSFESVG
jgi:uncharacterized protein (DUF1810 family)